MNAPVDIAIFHLRNLVILIFDPLNKTPCSVCNYTLHLCLIKRKYESEITILFALTNRVASAGWTNRQLSELILRKISYSSPQFKFKTN